MTSYEDTVALLEGLYREPHLPAHAVGLRRVMRLLEELGNPHHGFRSIHVAGSSGKGSVTSMVASILGAGGVRTGAFRSPHLHDYRERITVDGTDISRTEWICCFETVWPVVERMRTQKLPDYDLGRPALFEILFAIGALHFARRAVQWAVVETGMGGRLDATNTLASDVAAVTNIGLEHTQVLGNTIEKIAAEKAAIIKQGAHAVTAADGDALRVIRSRAREVQAPLLEVPRDVTPRVARASHHGQDVALIHDNDRVEIHLSLAGAFQATNAATAYAVVVAMRRRGNAISDEAVSRGFRSVRVPGRLEMVSEHPAVLLDGAQNTAGVQHLAESLRALQTPGPRVLVFAAMRDKDIEQAAQRLGPLFQTVIATSVPGADRSAAPETIGACFRRSSAVVLVEPDAGQALDRALDMVKSEGMVVVAGSLYLVGDARRRLTREGVS